MTTPAEGIVNKQDFFLTATTEYERAMDAHDVALDAVADCKLAAKECRDRQKDIEAECIVNGGSGMYTVSPDMNQAKRDAVIRMALKHSESYQAALKELNSAERELDRAEAQRDTAANRMRLARAKQDAYLAAADQQAAILQHRAGESRREFAGRR